MRKIRQITLEIQGLIEKQALEELRLRIFDYLFYSPKFPLRSKQQDLLARAERAEFSVFDPYFTNKNLSVKGFSWGAGEDLILLTHGWASKAADFDCLIERFLLNPRYRVVAFDAPGNGASEGRLTNLALYVESIHQMAKLLGSPKVLIGHSLGATANVMAYKELPKKPAVMVSLSPLVDLENYFVSQMTAVGISEALQERFFQDFKEAFNIEVNYFNLHKLYDYSDVNHLLFYDRYDEISPFRFMNDFLEKHTDIQQRTYDGIGHHDIIKNGSVISELFTEVDHNVL
ncbi:alpha/beta fold hydrolase [Olivibacter sp. XZL3]|uniref:alpha/beta fold hydrolase n=1 Tax=Olivibacter sp. XZL3 TaxID=1735116 RepID=UPI001066F98F|nr:alpha/beta hydrolase [Olivibacter sp. XZL3]